MDEAGLGLDCLDLDGLDVDGSDPIDGSEGDARPARARSMTHHDDDASLGLGGTASAVSTPDSRGRASTGASGGGRGRGASHSAGRRPGGASADVLHRHNLRLARSAMAQHAAAAGGDEAAIAAEEWEDEMCEAEMEAEEAMLAEAEQEALEAARRKKPWKAPIPGLGFGSAGKSCGALRAGVPGRALGRTGAGDDRYDTLVKILLLGDSGVGKTSILVRYSSGTFSGTLISTAGVDFKAKYLDVKEKSIAKACAKMGRECPPSKRKARRVKCQIWDTAGQERFHVITRTYYKGAGGIALVYDVSDRESFEHLGYWMTALKDHASKDVCKLLVANKIDLPRDCRAVSSSEGAAFAKRYGMAFCEVSAKSGANVEAAFRKLCTMVLVREGEAASANGQGLGGARRVPMRPKRPVRKKGLAKLCVIL
jgi:small GTP-binding protein